MMKYGSWRKVVVDRVLQGLVTQPLQNYIDSSQATVAEWVALRSILDVCARDTGYKGGGRLQNPW